MAKNPYHTPGRLSDVIAAITALGAYRYYKLTFQAVQSASQTGLKKPSDGVKSYASIRSSFA